MHIVVCVKMVPDTTQVKIDPETNTLIREGVPFITNPYDTNAVEEAIRFKDKYGAHITAVSMGPPAAESVLRKATSIGADECILLSDRAFGGADTLATSTVLGLAIKKIHEKRPVDIVLCGKQTIDGDTAQVGPGIARRMDSTQLTLVDEMISVDEENNTIRVRRKLESYHEIIDAKMPVMITVEREINTPRYPTVPGRLDASEVKVQVWDNNFLKLDPTTIGLMGSPTQVRRIFAPEREQGEVISGEGDQMQAAVDSAFNKLTEWDIVNVN
jgi:electron transfer flavoprotein beta subunit